MCQKRSYFSKREAKAALQSTRSAREFAGNERRTETRFYRCPAPECGGAFHITSIEEWIDA